MIDPSKILKGIVLDSREASVIRLFLMEHLTPQKPGFWKRIIQPHPAVTNPDTQVRARNLAKFMIGLSVLDLLGCLVYLLFFGSSCTNADQPMTFSMMLSATDRFGSIRSR